MSGTNTPPLTPPGQGGEVPGVGVGGVPPGFSRIPIEQLRAKNVPATDRKSLLKRSGSNVSVNEPVQNERLTPAEVAPPRQRSFIPSNAGDGPAATPGTETLAPEGGVAPPDGASAQRAATAAPLQPGATTSSTASAQPEALTAAVTSPNPVVLENQRPGNPRSEWDLAGPASSNIEGFATDISVNSGGRVDFKINTDSGNYRVDIYRLGYYGGAGARRVATLQNQAGRSTQPGPLRENSTGLVDAGNWSVTDSWTVPGDAVSGIYVAKLVRQDGTFGESHVPFIVRNDARTSDIVFQTADQTWQAYNGWGGASLYGGDGPGGGTAPGRAYAVSYNRPIGTRDGIGLYAGPQDFIFGAEYSALRWMERNGYDVSYITGVDASRNGALLRNSRIYTSVGHDEYWTGDQRRNVEAARDAGVNLAFMSGNEVYWKTRLAPSAVDGNANRTLVSYKETREGPIDPSSEWTGTWRDLTYSGATDGGRPENALTGTLFQVDSYRADAITIPYGQTRLRFWRDTSVANTQPGQTATLTQNYLGYEWDESPDGAGRPDTLIKLSDTTLPVSQYLMDFGNYVGSNNATHNLTLYRAPSGALVFGTGTVYWSWALDENHDLTPTPTDPRIQQAMVNLFADMGVQPETLDASLRLATRSTDTTAPVSTITGPASGATVGAGRQVTITGTASDTGGLVAAVEVSTDNGQSWNPAIGSASGWSYSWRTPAPGTYTIRSRAVDDSMNVEAAGAGRSVTVTPSSSLSVFQNDTPDILATSDTAAVQLGMKFTPSANGTVTGIRFYKGSQNTGTHTASLWTATGTRLASTPFVGETASGWQQVNFSSPVAVTAGTTYVAAYHSSGGRYAFTPNYFTEPVVSGQLTAPASAPNSPNGVFAYGGPDAFPNQGRAAASNYWVDAVYSPGGTTPTDPPPPTGTAVSLFSNTDTPATVTANDPNAVELGVKFTASQSGNVTGIRFYKGPQNTGTHIGRLWTAGGTQLASAPFTSETASGWQQVSFSAPVAITAGQTYIASYTAPNGNYSATGGYFANARTNGPLTAPASGTSGGNGVYAYGGAGVFPNQSFNATNYWVDTTFVPGGTTTPPPPAAGVNVVQSGGSTAVTEGGAGDSLTVALASQPTANVTVTVSGNADLRVASGGTPAASTALTFTAANWATPQTVSVSAVDDTTVEGPETSSLTFAVSSTDPAYNGRSVPAVSVAVTDNDSAPPPTGTAVSLFSNTDTPATVTANDPNAVELGVKFTASQSGNVTGIRFYKGPQNTGTHIGRLWTAGGTQLASAPFTSETASGWQQVSFSAPVAITAGQTYIASYTAPNGNYSATGGYFSTARTNGPLTAPASGTSGGNGVYAYGGAGVFPNQSFNATNYWVDTTFVPGGTTTPPPPAAGVNVVQSGGSTAVTEGGAGDSLTVALASQPTANVTVTVSGNADLRVASGGTPAASTALTFTAANWATPQTVSVSAVDDTTVEGPETSSLTFAVSSTDPAYNGRSVPAVSVAVTDNDSAPPPTGTAVSLFSNTDTPATVTANDPNAVELGVKFTASQSGNVTGIRFYKGPQNTGTHIGRLWTAGGTQLASAPFTSETASGWQQVSFSAPVAITAGQTYIASYTAPNGNYSATGGYFSTARTNGPLTAPASGTSGGNGVYAYGGAGVFPNQSFNATNYWVDVVFNGQLAA
jgi:hypothetical protein